MSFFHNEAKAEPKPRSKTLTAAKGQHIPVHSLNSMGCSACPQNDSGAKLRPAGDNWPEVFVLYGTPPSDGGDYGDSLAAGVINANLKRNQLRYQQGSIVRCAVPADREFTPNVIEVECCRGYTAKFIEEAAPVVVLAVGDAAMQWAMGLTGSAIPFRGTLMPGKFGKHVCWVLPILYPSFVHRKKGSWSGRKSEYELALEHDIASIYALLEGPARTPDFREPPFDKGLSIITGAEPGDMMRLEEAMHRLLTQPRIALDYETNALRPLHRPDPHIWECAIGTFDDTVAFAVDHPEGWGTDARIRKVRGMLGEFILYSGTKIAHNLVFEQEWTNYFYGARALRLTDWADTMAQAYVRDEREGTKGLGVQTTIRFGFNVKALSNIDTKRLLEYPIKQTLKYNGLDSKWTAALDEVNRAALAEEPTLEPVLARKERLAPTLVLTSAKGVPVDVDYVADLMDEFTERSLAVEAKIRRCPEVVEYERRFGHFAPTAPEAVLKLYDVVCKRDEVTSVDGRTGATRKSSDEEALARIPASEVPSAPLVLEHRGLEKLKGTYLGPIASGKVVSQETGRVHTQYGALRAVTGRLASDDPNLQNIPVRTADGKRIRGAFIAEPGGWIVAADYGQIEARCIGMATEDENLVRYQWTDYDIHGHWAKRIVEVYPRIKDVIVKLFKLDWDEKGLKTLRQETKNKWVFPQFFGSATRSCAANMGVEEGALDGLAREFWDDFQGVLRWQERIVKGYEKNLYVETLGGQRRRGPMSKNEIINMPIQGTAAEIVTEAMCALSEMGFAEDDQELVPNLNVHDDLSSWIDDARLDAKIDRIVAEMCRHRFPFINVPLVVEVKIGKAWNALEEVGVYRSDKLFNIRNPYL